jgi:hypothetical protein
LRELPDQADAGSERSTTPCDSEPAPLTRQVTAVLLVPVTVAVAVCDSPMFSVALGAATVTTMVDGGGGGGVLPPPPPPQAARPAMPMAAASATAHGARVARDEFRVMRISCGKPPGACTGPDFFVSATNARRQGCYCWFEPTFRFWVVQKSTESPSRRVQGIRRVALSPVDQSRRRASQRAPCCAPGGSA